MENLLSIIVILMFVGTLVFILFKSPKSDKRSILFNASVRENSESDEEVLETLYKAGVKTSDIHFLR